MTTLTNSELQTLKADTDARIRDLDRLMRTTPTDTLAYQAMAESRPGLMTFRTRLDDELDRRGL